MQIQSSGPAFALSKDTGEETNTDNGDHQHGAGRKWALRGRLVCTWVYLRGGDITELMSREVWICIGLEAWDVEAAGREGRADCGPKQSTRCLPGVYEPH